MSAILKRLLQRPPPDHRPVFRDFTGLLGRLVRRAGAPPAA